MLIHYLLIAVVFFAIDLVRLGLIAKDIYGKYLADFLSPEVNRPAAIIFYLIFIVGLMIFAIYPAIEQQSLNHALIYGALFGFFTYATYDLTNLATLKNRPIEIVFIDIIRGVCLCVAVSYAGFYIVKMVG